MNSEKQRGSKKWSASTSSVNMTHAFWTPHRVKRTYARALLCSALLLAVLLARTESVRVPRHRADASRHGEGADRQSHRHRQGRSRLGPHGTLGCVRVRVFDTTQANP